MIASRSSPWTRSRFLTKNRSALVLVEEVVEVGAVAQGVAQRVVDAVGVLDAHRDDAEALLGSLLGVLEDQLDDLADLGVAAVLAVGLIRAATGRARGAGTRGR